MSAYDDFCDYWNVTVIEHDLGGAENVKIIDTVKVPRDTWRDIEKGFYTALRSGSPLLGIKKIEMVAKSTKDGETLRGAKLFCAGSEDVIQLWVAKDGEIENPCYTIRPEPEEKTETEDDDDEEETPKKRKRIIEDDDDEEEPPTPKKKPSTKPKLKTVILDMDDPALLEEISALIEKNFPQVEVTGCFYDKIDKTINITLG